MKGITLVNYNFKGGVGKTTLTGMEAYILGKSKNEKILLIDFDPQANLSMMMRNTYEVLDEPNKTFYNGLIDRNLKQCRIHLNDNIDLIPADMDLNDWTEKIANLNRDERWHILEKLIAIFKSEYDYIMIDVPPTLNDIVRNAVFAADGISVVLQTQEMSYISALKTVQKLIEMRNDFNANFAFLGVVLYLRKTAKIDSKVEKEARDTFEGSLYENVITYQERVNLFTSTGIKNDTYWDKRAIGMYYKLTNELKDKIKELIAND